MIALYVYLVVSYLFAGVFIAICPKHGLPSERIELAVLFLFAPLTMFLFLLGSVLMLVSGFVNGFDDHDCDDC